MKWPVVPLSVVLDRIEAGRSPRAQERAARAGEYGVLKLSAISWGEFEPGQNKALLPDTDPSDCPTVRAGDLLISRANTTELIGSVVLVQHDYPHLLLSDKTLRLVLNPELGHAPFVLHALRTRIAREHIERHATGTSYSMRNISQDKLSTTPIPLPPLEEQRRIADMLKCAEGLRSTRRVALATLDSLAQAIFLDIFGDPARNPKRWPKATLGDLISVGPQNGLYRPASDYGSGTPIVRIDAFYDGMVTDLTSLKRVRISDEEQALYGLRPGEILINRVNSRDYLGKSAVIPELNEPTVFESNMMRFDVRRDVVLPTFLIYYLQTAFIRGRILQCAKDAINQSSINQQDVKAFPVFVPPIAEQTLFAQRLALKVRLHGINCDSLAALDGLLASLTHRAFEGEL
jgi:type I restriction enzyme, S subunit